ncbi:uncharacterized protein LOC135356372 [Latimeria chalumnae]|uniref:uncharacterized protein LOC135356372 n=1 Tax=Latimeria chalumnae TaxID=7897 RepID=UPI00313ACF9C
MHADTAEKVTKMLENAQSVSLTLDIWTDRRCHSYLAITAHTFVKCVSSTALVAFKSFKGSHTGIQIAEEIEHVIEEYNLIGKVQYILTDNAANMKKAFAVLKELQYECNTEMMAETEEDCDLDDETLWQDLDISESEDVDRVVEKCCTERLSCFAHSLQLVVKDGLKKANIARPVMAKCTKFCNLLHQSATFRDAFEGKFGSGRSIPAATDTRWNSTFKQLDAIAKLDQACLAELLNDHGHSNLIFTPKETLMLTEILEILQPFAEATDLTQGNRTSIGCVVPCIISLYRILTDQVQIIRYNIAVAKALLESLCRRFFGLLQNIGLLASPIEDKIQPFMEKIYLVASILDPAFCFQWLEDVRISEKEKQRLKESITELAIREAETTILQNQTQESQCSPPKKKTRLTLFSSYQPHPTGLPGNLVQTPRAVLLSYLDEISSMNMDDPWRCIRSEQKFQSIVPLLEKVFCIPATSAPVERIFSQSSLIVRPNRAKMGDDLLEKLVFLKCNHQL